MSKLLVGSALALGAAIALAACGSYPRVRTAASTTTTAQAGGPTSSTTTAPSIPTTAVISAGAGFVAIVEPFDPGHPAIAKSGPSDCTTLTTTVAIEQCYEDQTETTDAAIDRAQSRRYQEASASGRAGINADDQAWLAARGPVCQAAYQGGGSIDGIEVAMCLAEESAARLAALTGATPALAHLQGGANPDPGGLAYYTTPDGSRVGMVRPQAGSAVVTWVVIGGYRGFTVHTADFPYADGSFSAEGVAQGADPEGHQVGRAQLYRFSLDYPTLASDPNASSGRGGFDYAVNGATRAVFG